MRILGIAIAIVGLVRSTFAADAIALTSPLDHQVFQRSTPTQGVILVRGRLAEPGGRAEYRLTGKAVDGAWHPLELHDNSGTFSAEISAPAGGWFRLDIRTTGQARKEGIVIEHVGVGEVFLIAGQSNSTNYGKPRQKPSSGLVSTFDGKGWRIADDPQPGTQDKSTGGSFVPSFGDAMVERYHVPIGVASTGFGGTSVREWLPKGDRMKQQPTTGKHVTEVGAGEWESTGQLFDGMMTRIEDLGPHGFRAVLWHQGESDAGQAREGHPADRQITGEQYAKWLKRVIAASQEQAGWEFPWLVAQATYHSEKDPGDEGFRAAQKSVWDNRNIFPGADTDQLKAEFRDGVHFNGKGLEAHGKLWAEKVGAFLDPRLAQTPTGR